MRVEPEAILDLVPDVVLAMEPDGQVAYVNAAAQRILGWSFAEIVGRNAFDFVHPDERAEALDRIAEQLAEGHGTRRHHVEILRRDGGYAKFELLASTSADVDGALVLALRDISERAETQRRLHRSDEQLRALSDNVPDALGRFDVEGQLVFATRRFRELADAHDDLTRQWAQHVQLALTTGELVEVEHPVDDPAAWISARFVPELDSDGEVTHVLVIATDVTERKEAELRLLRAATHDALTGLVNRQHLRELADRVLTRSAVAEGCEADDSDAEEASVALVFIDLDGFKAVNDLHGHHTGDAVLAAVGRRLAEVVRPQDVVARFGGDEFVMLCDGLTADDATRLADRIALALAEPVRVGDTGDAFQISASIGVAAAAPGSADFDQLLQEADGAMYRAKAEGGDQPPLVR